MREIKFRGQLINGEWVYGLYSYMPKKNQNIQAGHYISNSFGMPFAYLIRPETLGQYTGLKDKSNNNIYEGDILNHQDKTSFFHDVFQLVTFEEASFCVRWLGDSWERLHKYIAKATIIIGNIHENKELWKYPEFLKD